MVSDQMLRLQQEMQRRIPRIRAATYADAVVVRPANNHAFIVEVWWNNRQESVQHCVSPAAVFGSSEQSTRPVARMTACQLMRVVIARVMDRRT